MLRLIYFDEVTIKFKITYVVCILFVFKCCFKTLFFFMLIDLIFTYQRYAYNFFNHLPSITLVSISHEVPGT